MEVCSGQAPNLSAKGSACETNIIIECTCSMKTPTKKAVLEGFTDKRNETQCAATRLASPNGPPPSIPTTPKPQTAISKLEIEPTSLPGKFDFKSYFENTTDTDDEWSSESYGVGIKRRYSDIPRQKCPHSPKMNQRLVDSTTTVYPEIAYKFSRFTSTSSLRNVHSPLTGFDRNSPGRIAKRRRSRKTAENHSPRKAESTDMFSLTKYKRNEITSQFKQSEIPCRNVE